MKTYIAILRGINVSGSKMIKMNELRAHLEGIGLQNITSYIQSGNLIFRFQDADPEIPALAIEKKIKKEWGFTVPVLVKTLEEWKDVLMNNPFLNERNEDIGKLHVTFLSHTPDKVLIDKLADFNSGTDEFIFSGKAIYLFCPNGYGRTKLTNNFFESKLKTSATTRNWKTVIKLAELAEEN